MAEETVETTLSATQDRGYQERGIVHAPRPGVLVARDVRVNVPRACGQDDLLSLPCCARGVGHLEQTVVDLLGCYQLRLLDSDGRVVLQNLLSGVCPELGRVAMVPGGNHVHVLSCAVAIVARVEEDGCVVLAGKREGCGQAGWAAADDQDVDGRHSSIETKRDKRRTTFG
jgi:hypothetical protein